MLRLVFEWSFNFSVLAFKPLQKLKEVRRPTAESLIQVKSAQIPDSLPRNNSPPSRRSNFGDTKASITRYININKKGEIKGKQGKTVMLIYLLKYLPFSRIKRNISSNCGPFKEITFMPAVSNTAKISGGIFSRIHCDEVGNKN